MTFHSDSMKSWNEKKTAFFFFFLQGSPEVEQTGEWFSAVAHKELPAVVGDCVR